MKRKGGMPTIAELVEDRRVIAGVDTHKDLHVAAVLDELGRLLDTRSFPTTSDGYRRLARWVTGHGEVLAIGVEGTSSWGAGLCRHLRTRGFNVLEVNRPNRQTRRRRGKSDTIDAEAAARAVLAGDATVVPKAGNGPVEALRQLRVARSGALKARTAAANQLRSLVDTAPDAIRGQLRALSTRRRVGVASRYRPGDLLTPAGAAKRALTAIARRWAALDAEIVELDHVIKAILDTIAAPLLERPGLGYETVGTLLCTAGDNPDRLDSDRSFAALCGTSPVPVSSGRSHRHRINRAGDRQANSALWWIVMVRLRSRHAPTVAYLERRLSEGRSNRDTIRCLKRYVAREVYTDIRNIITNIGPPLEQAA
jgi:transposase